MIKKVFEEKISVSIAVIIGIIVYRLSIFYIIQPKFDASLVHGIFTNIIFTLNQSPLISVLVSTLFILIQGLIILRLVDYYDILGKPGSSVLLSLGIFSSIYPETLFINQIYLANTFFLIATYSVFQFLEKNYKKSLLLKASFLFGLSALTLSEFYWSFVLMISLIIIFKSVKLSDILIVVFGMVIPFYIVASLGYLFSWDWSISNNWRSWLLDIRSTGLDWTKSSLEIITLILLVMIALFGVIRQVRTYFRFNVEIRRSLLAMMVIALFLFLVLITRWYVYRDYFLVLSIPLSIYHSIFFKRERKNWWITGVWYLTFFVAISPTWWDLLWFLK